MPASSQPLRHLITGGGGFLGYYLVQAALYWNDKRASGARIDVTVYDNYVRGVPEWLEALRPRKQVVVNVRNDDELIAFLKPAQSGHCIGKRRPGRNRFVQIANLR